MALIPAPGFIYYYGPSFGVTGAKPMDLVSVLRNVDREALIELIRHALSPGSRRWQSDFNTAAHRHRLSRPTRNSIGAAKPFQGQALSLFPASHSLPPGVIAIHHKAP